MLLYFYLHRKDDPLFHMVVKELDEIGKDLKSNHKKFGVT